MTTLSLIYLDVPTVMMANSPGPFYGGPTLFVAAPQFLPPPGDAEGFAGVFSVWKSTDETLLGQLSTQSSSGTLIVDGRAQIAGLQRVPAEVPASGCWTLDLSTPSGDSIAFTFKL